MTSKELIEMLKILKEQAHKSCKDTAVLNVKIDSFIFVIDEAIKALEQEPTTRNCYGCKYSKDNHNAGTEECHLCMWENQYTPTTKNDLGVDCISRDEVCRYVAEFVNHEFSTKEEEELINNIITGIERMTSATPQEPKTGHWIEIAQYSDGKHKIECSECKGHIFSRGHANSFKVKNEYKFCPHCGKRMIEP